MIYFDNAATGGKKPKSVINAVNNALLNYSANPGRSGHTASMNAAMQVYNARIKIKNMFGAASEENVVFLKNCTEALNTVIKGTTAAGDNIVVSSLEHNAVIRPLYQNLKQRGVTYSIAESVPGDDEKTLANIKNKVTENTKLVLCTHASNVFGCVQPVAEIGRFCKENGILFCVDAAQTGGVLNIDMQKQNIDFLCLAPHKGLYAPMGLGVLIAEKTVEYTVTEGGTGTDSLNLNQPEMLPERLESGTLNLPAIMGLSAGIDYINAHGINNIYKAEMQLANRFYSGLEPLNGIRLYMPKPKTGNSVPVVSFNIKNKSSTEVAEQLNMYNIAVRPGLHCAPLAHKMAGTLPDGTVRVSFGSFNTVSEVDYAVNCIKKILKIS